jgi:hypothetical protein
MVETKSKLKWQQAILDKLDFLDRKYETDTGKSCLADKIGG